MNNSTEVRTPWRLSASERRWALAGVLLLGAIVLTYMYFAQDQNNPDTITAEAIAPALLPPSHIELRVHPLTFDATTDTATFRVSPSFSGAIGRMLGDTAVAATAVRLSVDGASSAITSLAAGDTLGPFDIAVAVHPIRATYDFPFDVYGGQLMATAASGPNAIPVPIVISVEVDGIPGYRIAYSSPAGFDPAKALTAGDWTTVLRVERTGDVKMSTVLMALLMLISACGVMAIGALVFIGRRPVSTGAYLMFVSIFPFSIIALRTAIPNLPTSDIRFDTFVFHPSVALAFLALIGGIIRWLATPTAN